MNASSLRWRRRRPWRRPFPEDVGACPARVEAKGFRNVALQEADARSIPFADATHDVLYNSYMLDLIRLCDMPAVITEFRRVLQLGGRLVLVDLSKPDGARITWFERLFERLPAGLVQLFLGDCRPVLMREHLRQPGTRR
jgi:ubiquinone/menaquinone biosynthesis C-methylase UbiE